MTRYGRLLITGKIADAVLEGRALYVEEFEGKEEEKGTETFHR
jgi:hypothetical protein